MRRGTRWRESRPTSARRGCRRPMAARRPAARAWARSAVQRCLHARTCHAQAGFRPALYPLGTLRGEELGEPRGGKRLAEIVALQEIAAHAGEQRALPLFLHAFSDDVLAEGMRHVDGSTHDRARSFALLDRRDEALVELHTGDR